MQAEEPVEPSIPELTVTGPSVEVAGNAEDFTVTFVATHDKDLEYLEIDHNLGKHGSLPSEVEGLPEFKLYPNAENPWGSEEAAQQAETYGVSAIYGAANTTWEVTFGGKALDDIRALTAEYTNKQFKIYSLVCDVDDIKSGSMYDGSYEVTVVTLAEVEEPVEVPSTYAFSIGEGDLDNIVANQEATIDVTFATAEKGDYGYDGVRFKFSVTGAGDAIFEAMDSEGNVYETTNNGYWGPGDGFAIGAEYEATTPWTVIFTEAGEYTVTVSLIDADSEEVVADITETFTVNVQAAEPSIPELTVTGPAEEVAGDAENFKVTFVATHDKELSYLEIDHNLGKHGSLPSEVEGLPEFKLYPNADNPWAPTDMEEPEAGNRKTEATEQGLEATYSAGEKTWTITFGKPVLNQIRNLTAEYSNNEFRIYSLVRDIEGVQSGSMHDGSYETTIVTLVIQALPEQSTYKLTHTDCRRATLPGT